MEDNIYNDDTFVKNRKDDDNIYNELFDSDEIITDEKI
jgi:hypothetical protein